MPIEKIKQFGFDNVSQILTENVVFDEKIMEYCKMNTCGNFGKCYTCPPYVGIPSELIKKTQGYKKAILYQKIYKLEDSFDVEGMENSVNDFRGLTRKLGKHIGSIKDDFLILGAGGCDLCKTCGVIDGIPCRFPKLAYPSLESYCINVSCLAEAAGMKYINGQNTATYFGAIFYND